MAKRRPLTSTRLRVGAEAAKVEVGGAARDGVAGRAAIGRGNELRRVVQDILDIGFAGKLDIERVDHRDRRRGVEAFAGDARAGDDQRFLLGLIGCWPPGSSCAIAALEALSATPIAASLQPPNRRARRPLKPPLPIPAPPSLCSDFHRIVTEWASCPTGWQASALSKHSHTVVDRPASSSKRLAECGTGSIPERLRSLPLAIS